MMVTPVFASATTFKEVQLQPLDRVNRTGAVEMEPTNHTWKNPLIRVTQVVLDWDAQNMLVGLDGVHGELYIVRLSQEETGLVMEEELYYQDDDITLNFNVSLHKDLHYTVALYDYYNVWHSSFTWRQPFDFEAKKAVVVMKDPIITPDKPLAKTDDLMNNPITYAVMLGTVLLLLAIVKKARRERSSV